MRPAAVALYALPDSCSRYQAVPARAVQECTPASNHWMMQWRSASCRVSTSQAASQITSRQMGHRNSSRAEQRSEQPSSMPERHIAQVMQHEASRRVMQHKQWH